VFKSSLDFVCHYNFASPVRYITIVARQKIRAASAGDLIIVIFDLNLIGSLKSPPSI